MSSYYKCSLFNTDILDYSNFTFIQDEIVLEKNTNNRFKIEKIAYKCKFIEFKLNKTLPTIIIPIKDNFDLIKYTLNNLADNNINIICNIIVVDDRSSREDIKTLCIENKINYLRVDNDKGFNFSTLNNIAAKICYDKGCCEIILWNSDLWTPDRTTVPKLLALHRENGATISGTRLIYPNFKWDGKSERLDVQELFKIKKTHRGTLQFGGTFMTTIPGGALYPIHLHRFKPKEYPPANENRHEIFVTGAFQIINLQWFIDTGGLNPSLSTNFQDVDLCFKAKKDKKFVMYSGKDLYLWHDESVSLKDNRSEHGFISDNVLYSKIWTTQEIVNSVYGFGE